MWRDKVSALMREKDPRWYALVALEMIDTSSEARNILAEWYYLLICSPSYQVKPKSKGPLCDPKYTIVSEELDLDAALREARERVDQIHAVDWNAFYEEMDKRFMDDK